MTTIRTDINIDRPPEAVARVLLDPSKATLWTSNLERFEVVSGQPGEVGSRARLHYRDGGRAHVMEDVLLETEANRKYVSVVTGAVLTARVETILTPVEAGTRVSIRWTGRGRVFPLRFILPFLRKAITRQAAIDLKKLKHVVEGGA